MGYATKTKAARLSRIYADLNRCQIVALCAGPVKYVCTQCERRFCEQHRYTVVQTPFPCCPVCKGAARTL